VLAGAQPSPQRLAVPATVYVTVSVSSAADALTPATAITETSIRIDSMIAILFLNVFIVNLSLSFY
jgi:hypothetical protein